MPTPSPSRARAWTATAPHISGTYTANEITLTWDLRVRDGGKPPDPGDLFNVSNSPNRFVTPRTLALKRGGAGAGALALDRIADRGG